MFAIINLIIAIFRPLGLIVLHYPINIQTSIDVIAVTTTFCNRCPWGVPAVTCIVIRCKAHDGNSVIHAIGLGVLLNLTNKRVQCSSQLLYSFVRHGARLVDHQHNIQRLGGRSRYLTRYVCLQLEFVRVLIRSCTSQSFCDLNGAFRSGANALDLPVLSAYRIHRAHRHKRKRQTQHHYEGE